MEDDRESALWPKEEKGERPAEEDYLKPTIKHSKLKNNKTKPGKVAEETGKKKKKKKW